MKPNLKTEMDRLALWENLKLGVIDIIVTDHAPHTREDKLSEKPPFGVPGLETSLPLLLTAVAEEKLTLDQVVKLTSTNPRKIFGIRESVETFTEVDLKESYVIDARNLKTKCAWTPFEGKRVTGKISRVVLRGKTVYDGEQVIGEPKGNIIYPT
jgi:carbamoyl-phosphate synthase/aspartate carbamoyltransferase/dihydroorotase